MEDNVSTPERIARRIGRQTKNAIAWTGAVQAFFSALGLAWTLWGAWKGGGEDERRRERQDREDARRRRKADKEEAEAEKKRDAAIEQLRLEVKTVREDLETQRRDLKADREIIAKCHKVELLANKLEIERLEQQNAALRRRLDSSPGWAPGGSGETSTAAGG